MKALLILLCVVCVFGGMRTDTLYVSGGTSLNRVTMDTVTTTGTMEVQKSLHYNQLYFSDALELNISDADTILDNPPAVVKVNWENDEHIIILRNGTHGQETTIVNGSTTTLVTGIIYYNTTGYTDIQPYKYLRFIYYTGVGWVHPQL